MYGDMEAYFLDGGPKIIYGKGPLKSLEEL